MCQLPSENQVTSGQLWQAGELVPQRWMLQRSQLGSGGGAWSNVLSNCNIRKVHKGKIDSGPLFLSLATINGLYITHLGTQVSAALLVAVEMGFQ